MKRILDILLSGIAIVILLPILIPIAFLLFVTGEGKVFYKQKRVGRFGKIFLIYKFATMLENSPNIGTGTHTTKNDPRVLPVGGFLRSTKINELPQLINIFLGDMSIIGPRPTVSDHFNLYPVEARRIIEKMRPGLSGIGSIIFRDEESILSSTPLSATECYQAHIAPYKSQLEVWYADNYSIWLDLQLIVFTLLIVLNPATTIHRRWLKNLPPVPKALQQFIG